MRTQEEILKMIQQLNDTGCDPSRVQQKTLFHKLEWKNAVKWIHPQARTSELRKRFESMNSLAEIDLRREMVERIDQLFMMLADGDVMKVYIHLQMILVYLWLLNEEALFIWLHTRLGWTNCNWRAVGRYLAEELGINWKVLELRYV